MEDGSPMRRLLDHFRAESTELFQLSGSLDRPQDAPIPACPGLTVADIVVHVGTIYRLVTGWVQTGSRPLVPPRVPTSDVLTWAADGARDLHVLLSALAPEAPCATWCATDRTAGFWFRRMAHETAIHRIDVAQALGRPWTVQQDLAADGVDEAIELWLGTQLGALVNGSGRVVRIGAAGSSWLIRPLASLVDFPTAAAVVDAEITGDPSAMLAWAWGRSDADHQVQVVGDNGAAAELRSLLARAQQ